MKPAALDTRSLLRKRRRSKRKCLSHGIGRPGVILAEASYRAPGHLSVHVPGIYTFPSAGAMAFVESAQEQRQTGFLYTRFHRTKQ